MQSIINEIRRKRSNQPLSPLHLALETRFTLLAEPQPENEVPNWAHEILSAIIINRCNTHKSWGGHSIAYTDNHIIEDTACCVEATQSS